MKGILALILAFLLFFSLVPAQELEQIYNSKSVVIEATISSSAELITQPDSLIDYVQADLYIYPENEISQTVGRITTNPKADKIIGGYRFRWDNPDDYLEYRLNAEVKTENRFNKVRKKIEFPVRYLPPEYSEYLRPTDKIDSTDGKVVAQASQLAEGEDDLFVVVSKIAIWTKNNIKYDLSTLTADVSQKASWVLENRFGVCDELTSLFIAMLRSLGIPARFVSGVSFTNSPLFPQQWGAHGWAEVYFPDVGWIPFDPTFGEFGWIDPGHVKLKDSLDPTETSVKFEWKGKNVDLKVNKIEVTGKVKEYIENAEKSVKIQVAPVKKEVGFGSYNLAEVEVTNLKGEYITAEFIMASVKELEILGENKKQVILKPYETKKIFWKIKISENLDRGYSYDVPILIYTLKNEEDKVFFKTSNFDPVYSSQEMDRLIENLKDQESKTLSNAIGMSCTAEKSSFYFYENNRINCSVKNKGNTVIRNLNVCLHDDCKKVNLGINQETIVDFDFSLKNVGERELDITAENEGISRIAKVTVEMLDEPLIEIVELRYPETVNYGDIFELSFVLKKQSYSNPKSIFVSVIKNENAKEFQLEELASEHELVVELEGKDLKPYENNFNIEVSYYDKNKRAYSASKDFVIFLNKPTLFQRIAIFFSNLFSFLA